MLLSVFYIFFFMKVVSKLPYYSLLIIILRASINITHYLFKHKVSLKKKKNLFMHKVYHWDDLEEINIV